MSADLERLLRDTAVEPEWHPDPARLVARGRRRRRTRRVAAGAGAVLAVLVVAVLVPGILPDHRPMIIDQPSPDARPSPTAATATFSDTLALVDSQATLPQEPADEFADIATTAADAQTVWQRFNLAGDPPQVDFDTAALLFVGFGESGSCPARFDGMSVDGDRVDLVIGTEGGPVCTSDYNPRTMVLGVARDALPDGGFELTVSGRTLVLSSVPLSEPLPYDDSVVGRLTSESPELGFDARPSSVPGGSRIELVLANEGDVSASTGSWSMALYRWDDQRWLPADGDQGLGEAGGSLEDLAVTVEPGDQQVIAHVVTEALEPGWYGVYAKLQLGGRGGAVEIYESFEVAAQ